MATPKCDFYVYMYFRCDGTPLYVGKGRGTRWIGHSEKSKGTNAHFRRILAIEGRRKVPVVKLREHLTAEQALEIEKAFIKAIGRSADGGPLVNMTPGGDDCKGYIPGEETRRRMSESRKGRKSPKYEGYEAHNKGKKASDEAREKMRVAHALHADSKREKARAFHANMTPEQKAARAALISKTTREAMTPDVRAVISASRKGKSTPPNKGRTGQPNSPEARAKISAAWQRKYAEGYVRPKHTEETKAKMSASQQRNAEARRNGHD